MWGNAYYYSTVLITSLYIADLVIVLCGLSKHDYWRCFSVRLSYMLIQVQETLMFGQSQMFSRMFAIKRAHFFKKHKHIKKNYGQQNWIDNGPK